jgi:hypothetical protein
MGLESGDRAKQIGCVQGQCRDHGGDGSGASGRIGMVSDQDQLSIPFAWQGSEIMKYGSNIVEPDFLETTKVMKELTYEIGF